MSHTDKTRPHWVKMSEHPQEVHNHINGVCEIADGTVTVENNWPWNWNVHCHFEAQWWRSEFRCGCDMCGFDKTVNRVNRYAARRELHRYINED